MPMNKVIMSVFTLIDIKDDKKSMNIINLNIYLKNKLFLISIISLICLSLIAFQETNRVHNWYKANISFFWFWDKSLSAST